VTYRGRREGLGGLTSDQAGRARSVRYESPGSPSIWFGKLKESKFNGGSSLDERATKFVVATDFLHRPVGRVHVSFVSLARLALEDI
jgi:hypothetical protein